MLAAFILRRCLMTIPMLLAISFVSFVIIELPPGSFLEQKLVQLEMVSGDASSMIHVEQLKRRYGMDRPFLIRYLTWIKGIVIHGDFGESFAYEREVSELIWSYLGYTVLISSLSLILVYALALPLGAWAAQHRGRWQDTLMSCFSFAALSIPEFLLALFLLAFGVFYLDYCLIGLNSPEFTFSPWNQDKILDLLIHLPLPVLVVALNGTAGLARIMRSSMLDVLGQPYILAARARGLSRSQVLGRHALRMAINPMISILGMSLPGLISGSAIISIVLNLPTAGLLLFESLKSQDMYLAGTLVLMMSALLILGNLLADIALAVADPRIRHD